MKQNPHHREALTEKRTLLVIPARTDSSRLPGKLLLSANGKSILQHTFESALMSNSADEVIIAAADDQIAAEARRFGAAVVRTDPALPSGTDRVAEVARQRADADILVNVQGDEPEISASAIDAAVNLLRENPSAMMSTLATPIRSREQLDDPSCVKVVFGDDGRALYFSRSAIPHARDGLDESDLGTQGRFFQHVGLYAYRRELLLRLAALPPSPLEQIEKLEQLRILGAGIDILVTIVDHAAHGIDTADDYERFVARMSA